jgi:hypothetical protein
MRSPGLAGSGIEELAVNTLAWTITIALLLAACDDPTPSVSAAADAAAPRPSSSAAPAKASVSSPTASATLEKAPLQLLRLTLTSAVKDKEPVDELKAAGPGQRVWAHLALRNRTGEAQRITLIFRVDGEERSTVDLKVESSWSFRTWGYNTLRPSDKTGELTVEVRELGGAPLTTARLPIKAAPPPKPGDK